jgi:hypothetical protein
MEELGVDKYRSINVKNIYIYIYIYIYIWKLYVTEKIKENMN